MFNKNGPSIKIIFNGVSYRRYPESDRRELRQYFTAQAGDRLHRAIWEDYHKKQIPEGFCIHHIDENTLNNDITNLQLISITDHQKHHSIERLQDSKYKKFLQDTLSKAQESAKEWHSSEEGREWHSQHAKDVWNNAQQYLHTCVICKHEFTTRTAKANVCSQKCFAKQRRDSGIDNETRSLRSMDLKRLIFA